MTRVYHVWKAAREVGVTYERVAELTVRVRGMALPAGYRPAHVWALVADLTAEQRARLEQAIRTEQADTAVIAAYEAEAEALQLGRERDRRLGWRLNENADPHTIAQLEGWGS